MKKKILFLTLFVLIILLCNNSYAFDVSDISYEYMETLTTSNVSDFVTFLKNYVSNTTVFFKYNIIYNDANYYYICSSATLPYQRNIANIRFQPIGNNDFWNISETQSPANRFTIYKSTSASRINNSYSVYSNTQNYSLSSDKIKFCNFDLVDESNNLVFAKNFDLQSSSEESEPIDMTEIIAPLEHIKAFLFLICMYLLCKVVYGVIWWLYNKILL